MVITIDGLGVNGKSTLAERISEELGFKNFNTGAIYRCIALEVIRKEMNIQNIEKVLQQIENIKIDFKDNKVYLYDEDVTKEIRTEEISFYSTKWATIPELKEFVKKFQRKFIKQYDTVMEGRDIGARIVPDAEIKFYLYSNFETRVKRLWNMNQDMDIDKIKEDLKARDELDIYGGNFMKPDHAIEIDTTNYSLEEVYEMMMNEIDKRIKQ